MKQDKPSASPNHEEDRLSKLQEVSKAASSQLSERVKELACLYEVARLCMRQELKLGNPLGVAASRRGSRADRARRPRLCHARL
jgi:hypothetical protein